MRDIVLEVVVDSVESAVAAEKGRANRVELCDSLVVGGTTPSIGVLEMVRKYTNLEVFAMIRPRGGDFCYSDLEFEVMKRDIELMKHYGAHGVVFGILKPNGHIDKVRMKELIEIAKPLKVTCHRAFDMTNNPYEAVEDLMEIEVDRLLTSGNKNTAYEGKELIRELVEKYGDKIVIMPGSGINISNAKEILEYTKAKEIHMSGKKKIESRMIYRNPNVLMGGGRVPSEYEGYTANKEIIEKIAKELRIMN